MAKQQIKFQFNQLIFSNLLTIKPLNNYPIMSGCFKA